MKNKCFKCEWHHTKEDNSYNCTNNIIDMQRPMIDICIHPKLNDFIDCKLRNSEFNCKYYQPKRSFLKKVIDIFKGKKWIDICNDYQNCNEDEKNNNT